LFPTTSTKQPVNLPKCHNTNIWIYLSLTRP